MTKRYVVAVRREYRDRANLEDVLGGIDGLRVVGINGPRAQVEATDEAAAQLRARLGKAYFVEELVERVT